MLGKNRNVLPVDVSGMIDNHQRAQSNLSLRHSASGLDGKRAQNSRLKRAAERDMVIDDVVD